MREAAYTCNVPPDSPLAKPAGDRLVLTDNEAKVATQAYQWGTWQLGSEASTGVKAMVPHDVVLDIVQEKVAPSQLASGHAKDQVTPAQRKDAVQRLQQAYQRNGQRAYREVMKMVDPNGAMAQHETVMAKPVDHRLAHRWTRTRPFAPSNHRNTKASPCLKSPPSAT